MTRAAGEAYAMRARRGLLGALGPFVACMVACVVVSPVAWAGEPWWHVSVISAPAGPNAEGHGRVDVDVANVGDAATPGTLSANLAEAERHEAGNFTIVEDRLPAGVRAVEAHAEGGGTNFGLVSEFEIERILGRNLCTVEEPQLVRCEYAAPVRPFEQIIVAITVEAEGGGGSGTNETVVTGGGAPTVREQRHVAVAEAGAYGPQTLEVDAEEPGGTVTAQAGKHPFQLTSTLMLATQTETVKKEGHAPYLEVVPLGLTKDVNLNLPAGLIGNPTPLPKCNIYTFLQSVTPERTSGTPECPNDSIVGVASPIITSLHLLGKYFVPYPTLYPVVNLEPSAGEPAKFGFGTPLGPVLIDTAVRTGSDYGVVASVHDALSNAPFIGSVVTFWGTPGDPRHDNSRNRLCLEDTSAQEKATGGAGPEPACSAGEESPQPFLVMPTSCEDYMRASVQTREWPQVASTEPLRFTEPLFSPPLEYTLLDEIGEPYTLSGCNRLNFEPSIRVAPDGQQASTPTGLTVDVHVPQAASLSANGLAESAVKRIVVTLPNGVTVDPSGANGLQACSERQMGFLGREGGELRFTGAEPSCPDAAKIAKVTVRTPLLPNPIEGALYLATPYENPFPEPEHPGGALLVQYIVAKDPVSGVLVKLAGVVHVDPTTGQLSATFESPQVPFEDAEVHFFGGSLAPLGTPATCGEFATGALFVPWSASEPVPSSSRFAIASGPGGAPCPAGRLPFSPTLTGGSLNLQAGAFTPFTTTMSREDGNQDLASVQLDMPPGVSGLLTGVKLCGEAEANAGTCGPESLIGETTVSVGLGSSPFSVKGGRVYITGPYDGAPFGLSIVNPAKAGPFDLEKGTPCDCLVVRAKIEVDPITAQLTVTTDTAGPHVIPTMIDGIPLLIRHVNVTIDRPGFTFNPTNCSPSTIAGTLTSSQGAASGVNVPFQVTNCATLGFKPRFGATTNGKTSRRLGAGLRVKLVYPRAQFGSQANIKSVRVSLPKQLPSRLATLQHACPAAVFNANPALCSTQSKVGTARAITPLLPVPLVGPAYFVSYGGAKFPELVIVLQGYGITIELHGETFINEKTSITTSTFKTVPDAPVGSFELTLPQGPNSALAANANLCTHKLFMPTIFTAQNGAVHKQRTKISVGGCRKKHKPKHKHRQKHK